MGEGKIISEGAATAVKGGLLSAASELAMGATPQEQAQGKKDFEAAAKKMVLDYDSFHLGWDNELCDAMGAKGNAQGGIDLLNKMFDSTGAWRSKGAYQYIVNDVIPLGNKALEKAFKACWGLMFTRDPAKLAVEIAQRDLGRIAKEPGPGAAFASNGGNNNNNSNGQPVAPQSEWERMMDRVLGAYIDKGCADLPSGKTLTKGSTLSDLKDSPAALSVLRTCVVEAEESKIPALARKYAKAWRRYADGRNTELGEIGAVPVLRTLAKIRKIVKSRDPKALYTASEMQFALESLSAADLAVVTRGIMPVRFSYYGFITALAIIMRDSGWRIDPHSEDADRLTRYFRLQSNFLMDRLLVSLQILGVFE